MFSADCGTVQINIVCYFKVFISWKTVECNSESDILQMSNVLPTVSLTNLIVSINSFNTLGTLANFILYSYLSESILWLTWVGYYL
jgi:hypothetical protein